MTSAKDILQTCDYTVKYNFVPKDRMAYITLTWLPGEKHAIQWNEDIDGLINSLDTQIIRCPHYATKSIVESFVRKVCKHYSYPLKYVDFYTNDKPTDKLEFFSQHNDKNIIEKGKNLNTITTDILQNGLRPEHIELSRESDIWDGLNNFCEFHLGVKINDVIK